MNRIRPLSLFKTLAVSTLFIGMSHTPVLAQGVFDGTGNFPWMNQFLDDLKITHPGDSKSMHGNVRLVAGNDMWQAGHQFKNNSAWLALTCTKNTCYLQPATLSVKAETVQDHYTEERTEGQNLHFTLSTPSSAKVLVWFDASNPQLWMKPGEIVSYFSGATSPGVGKIGTLEAIIDLPGSETTSIVPMLFSPTLSPDGVEKFYGTDSPNSEFFVVLQLRSRGARQLLLGKLGQCDENIPTGAPYLLWVGDIDGDGKPDYLINFFGAAGQVQLYLSSAAKPEQLVGLAGWYDSQPNWAGCEFD